MPNKTISAGLLILFFILLSCGVSWSWVPKKGVDSKRLNPKTIQLDRDYDGRIDRIENYDGNADIVSIETDTTGDGKINEWIYYMNGKPQRAEKDMNQDGKVDTWIVYDENGCIISSESDADGDGKADEWVYYQDGAPYRAEKDANADGKVDTWLEY